MAQCREAVMELLLAAHDGNVSEVRRLVAEGADVNMTGEEGWRPLHLAAHEGRVEWSPRWWSLERT